MAPVMARAKTLVMAPVMAMEKAFRECPLLKKFYDANKDKDGSLNVKMTPEQAKPLCAKCKSHELKAGLMSAKLLCGAKKHGSGSGAKHTDKHGHEGSMLEALENAFGDCPALKKFYEANKGEDGSLNVDLKAEQAKTLCAEFKSTSGKCRAHAVVGKLLGGNCGSGGHEDFCKGAPTEDMARICRESRKKCETSSSDK